MGGFMKQSIWLSFFLLGSCVTKPQPQVAQCYCGPLISMTSQQKSCGIWEKAEDLDRHPPILRSLDADCTPSACAKMAQKICHKVIHWPHRVQMDKSKPAIDRPCYCDQVVIMKGNRPETVCAAWVPGEPTLLEYFALDQCNVETCQNEPFVLAQSHCQLGFVSFYQQSPDLLEENESGD